MNFFRKFGDRRPAVWLCAVAITTALRAEPNHPDFVPQSLDSANPSICARGLLWSSTNSRYECTGAICLNSPPSFIDENGNPVGTLNVDGGSMPFTNIAGNGITHHDKLCRIFTILEPIESTTLHAHVTVTWNSQTLYDKTYFFKVIVGGGQIKIEEKQKSVPFENVAFIRHIRPPTPGVLEKPDGAFPWYLNDFGYDPFYYRTSDGYNPPGLQAANAFKAHAERPQPASVKIRYQLTNKGVFVNPDPVLEVLGNGRNPRLTKPFEGTKDALISWDGQTGNEDDTVLTAKYYYIAPDGSEAYLCDDQTPQYRVANPPMFTGQAIQNPEKYCTFRSHRPTSLAAYTYAINPNTPNNPHLYQLRDANGEGMPGVWVQERFWFYVPDDAWTNDQYLLGWKWTTQRKGFDPVEDFVTLPYNVHGVFDSPDYLSYWQYLELDGHEYFAATNLGARRENQDPITGQYYLYPERQIYPGSSTYVYVGVYLNPSFKIIINPPAGTQTPTSQKSDPTKNGG